MTPKQKAIELLDKFKLSTGSNTKINIYVAKQCALIAVDLKIEGLPSINNTPPIKRLEDKFYIQYWNSVKNEIEKL